MENENKPIENIRKSRILIEVINDHRMIYGKEVIEETVGLVLRRCHPAIKGAIVCLDDFAESSGQSFQILFSAVMYGGTFHLLNLLNQVEIEELRSWIGVAPMERVSGRRFRGLERPGKNSIRIKVDKKVFDDCMQIAESLGLQDAEVICGLAFIAGLLEVDEIPELDRRNMLRILANFDEWIHVRVRVLRKRYKADEVEITRRLTGAYRVRAGDYVQEARAGLRPKLSRDEIKNAVANRPYRYEGN